ncbi:electron transport complex subunit E [Cocleimonas flava]|uniref:Ion-translocating oxidoreductase complex subunit E n=1 Tax=Cocleimonas flava TaxID=634765 RepID=A0A4R1F0K1_9GAMM|nr:electron transport complex subunit E [Cocleimonas flava]TCJ86770.1 electron transport complex protein RnfE [Cocleimonas flava]
MSATSPTDTGIDLDDVSPPKGTVWNKSERRKITMDGLWHNNPGLVQLLGLCPLLAVTGNLINGLGLGIATIITLTVSNIIIAFTRNWVRKEIRIPYYVLVIASIVTMIDLSMNAITPELHSVLGIFIPLIVTNCLIIGRAEAFASKNTIKRAALDGFMMGLGFTLVLIALGAIREIIGSGTLFADASLMFGDIAKDWYIKPFEEYQGFLLAILPPGAFLVMGFLIAMKNVVDKKLKS